MVDPHGGETMKRILLTLLDYWKKFGSVVGTVQSYIIITAVYFTILAVLAMVIKIFRVKLLGVKTGSSVWSARESLPKDLEFYRKQF